MRGISLWMGMHRTSEKPIENLCILQHLQLHFSVFSLQGSPRTIRRSARILGKSRTIREVSEWNACYISMSMGCHGLMVECNSNILSSLRVFQQQKPYDFSRSIRVLGNCRWRFFSGTNFSGRSFEVSGWEVLTRASKWGWREGQVASAKVLKR